ncbi:MAG: hypothetical protein WC765_00985 [Phycisphaerae bacterium]
MDRKSVHPTLWIPAFAGMTRNYETRLPRCVLLGRTLLAMTNGIFIDTLNNNAAIIPT